MTQPPKTKTILNALFEAALDVAQPSRCIQHFIPEDVAGNTIVIGAGKASASMARTFEQHWQGKPLSGVVVTRYGYSVECEHIKIIEAAHPVPDQAGMEGAQELLHCVQNLNEDDQVIVLISGGGSALLPLPIGGMSLEQKQAISQSLLRSGATINEMNTVRRHLSLIKGGRLAQACFPAKVITLLISDVPGDDLSAIASGPTVADATHCHDALAIIDKYAIDIPPAIREGLETNQYESIKPNDPCLKHSTAHLIATPQLALEAAANKARELGITPIILGDSIEGESKEVGIVMAGIAKQVCQYGQPLPAPCVLLSGGETTVTIKGKGVGGRNVEFLLSLVSCLKGHPNISALAADTDGVDGAAEIAGAYIDETTLIRAHNLGLDPNRALANNDAHTFFQAIGDSIITGPTLTNVNDFRAILILEN